MRSMLLMLLPLLCCSCGQPSQPRDHRWFNTYQSDRTCQTSRPPVHSDDIHSPTGRAHPF